MNEPTRATPMYRADIDGLRAVAVIAVVAYHAGVPGFPGGFVGVDVFFVISGFLITRLLLEEASRKGRISFASFYARRARRLLPALLTVIAGTVVLNSFLVPGFIDIRKFAASVRWSAFGFANVFFKRNTGGYFDGSTEEMPLLHLWSLGVEEQFYLCWPVLLGIGLSGKSLWSARVRRTAAILLLLALLSFIAACARIHSNQIPEGFFLMPYRAWELALGAVLSCFPTVAPRQCRQGVAWAALGLGAVLVPVAVYSSSTSFPGASALPPVLGTLLLLWAGGRVPENIISSALSSRPLTRIGLFSYGWYLWHWPLLVTVRLWNLGRVPGFAARLGALGFSLVLAELSLRWIETPARKGGALNRLKPIWVVAGSLVLSAGVLLSSLGIGGLQDWVLSRRLGTELVRELKRGTRFSGSCFSGAEIGSEHCKVSFSNAGKPASALAIWGDSHACSYFPMLEAYGLKHRSELIQYCQGQTLPLVGSSNSEAVLNDLRREVRAIAPAPVSVVLAARWPAYTGKRFSPLDTQAFPAVSSDSHNEEQRLFGLKEGLAKTFAALKAIGVHRVLVILPSPEFKFPLVRCLLRGELPCSSARQEVDGFRGSVVAAIRESTTGQDQVRLINPVTAFCDAVTCPQVAQGMPVTVDTNHPSVHAAESFGSIHSADLDWAAEPDSSHGN